jgi:DNA-binding CsgD family transcriptional regulator
VPSMAAKSASWAADRKCMKHATTTNTAALAKREKENLRLWSAGCID